MRLRALASRCGSLHAGVRRTPISHLRLCSSPPDRVTHPAHFALEVPMSASKAFVYRTPPLFSLVLIVCCVRGPIQGGVVSHPNTAAPAPHAPVPAPSAVLTLPAPAPADAENSTPPPGTSDPQTPA